MTAEGLYCAACNLWPKSLPNPSISALATTSGYLHSISTASSSRAYSGEGDHDSGLNAIMIPG